MVKEFTVIDNLRIQTSDRISVFGRTGSGKTFFAKNWKHLIQSNITECMREK